MMTTISQPPILSGTEKQQLVQIRQYLYQVSRDINVALHNLTDANFATAVYTPRTSESNSTEQEKQEMKQKLSALKSLIIKTADVVYSEMDKLEADLEGKYLAISDFGTYVEETKHSIIATSTSLEQQIEYLGVLTDELGLVSDQFKNYMINTSGYIKQGIVKYDGVIPIIGIAIGQDIKFSATKDPVVIDGKEYEFIDTSSNMSIWTPNKLSFYINNREVAYVSNGVFYTPVLGVSTQLDLGVNKWSITTAEGLTIKWIGG